MPREIIETGKTVDIAIEAACEQLGLNREDCDFEIIDLPKRGFLGLRNSPAKVKVWSRIEEEKPEPVKAAPPPAAPKQTRQQPQAKKEQPRKQVPVKEAAKQPAPAQTAPPAAADMPAFKAKRPERQRKESTSVINPDKIVLACSYLESILKELELEAEIVSREEDGGVCVNIEGKGLGAIIGRRGETLDAIQYLTSLVANRIDNDYMRITIDCGDYRMKRKETLEALAQKLSAQVLKTNVARTLEPMNPFERRIIHATVSEIEGVSSTSTGEEPNRRVVITSPTARMSSGRSDRGGRSDHREGGSRSFNRGAGDRNRDRGPRRDRDDRGGRSGSPRREQNATPAARAPRTEAPKRTAETSDGGGKLYTKIDLD